MDRESLFSRTHMERRHRNFILHKCTLRSALLIVFWRTLWINEQSRSSVWVAFVSSVPSTFVFLLIIIQVSNVLPHWLPRRKEVLSCTTGIVFLFTRSSSGAFYLIWLLQVIGLCSMYTRWNIRIAEFGKFWCKATSDVNLCLHVQHYTPPLMSHSCKFSKFQVSDYVECPAICCPWYIYQAPPEVAQHYRWHRVLGRCI